MERHTSDSHTGYETVPRLTWQAGRVIGTGDQHLRSVMTPSRRIDSLPMWRIILSCLVLGFALMMPRPADAHPHAWIDLRSGLVFDEDGRIEAIEQEWFFDYFYSAVIEEELVLDGRPIDEVLDELAQINLSSLKDFNYFTDFIADGVPIAVGEVTMYETKMRGERLWLKFTVPLVEPIDPRQQVVSYSIYDPSYYIEMIHMEGEPIMLAGSAPVDCSALTKAPDPTFEAVALASALDRTQTGPSNLGALFAEWVHVTCD